MVLITLVVFISHKIKLSQEKNLLAEAGYINPVSVGDYSLNTFIYGNENGKHTLVGLSGMTVTEYAVAVRPTTDNLADDNKIVIIDRVGYGMSDDSKVDMTIEQIVNDYRTALKNSGCEAPYVLLAHSLGGDYASYWVNKYPEEIEGVIYFDPDTAIGDLEGYLVDDPEAWWNTPSTRTFDCIMNNLGFARIYMKLMNLDFSYKVPPELSEYSAAFRNRYNASYGQMSEEILYKENAYATRDAIDKNNSVPKLYIDANPYSVEDFRKAAGDFHTIFGGDFLNYFESEGISLDDDEKINELFSILVSFNQSAYDERIIPYIEMLGNCEYVNIPGSHYIFSDRPEEVTEVCKDFLDKLD